MSASRRTSKIPQKEWEARKRRIIELYSDNGLQLAGPNGVIQRMENEGFAATKSQYERQFHIWEVRKNIKQHEWARIIQTQRQGGDVTPTIPKNIRMRPTRLERAGRRYAHIIPQTEESVSHHSGDVAQENTEPLMLTGSIRPPGENTEYETPIAITELADQAINAAPYADDWLFNADQSMPSHESPGMLTSAIGFPDSPNSLPHWPQALGGILVDSNPVSGLGVSPELLAFDLTGRQPMGIVGAQYEVTSSPLAGGSGDTALDCMQYLHSSAISSPYPHVASDSPRFIFQKNEWKLPSTIITSRLIEDIYNEARTTYGHGPERSTFALANNFLAAIKGTDPTTLGFMVNVEQHPVTHTRVLANLLSTKIFFGEGFFEPPNDVAMDVITKARLYSRLTTSAINGFTGLKNIPATGVLKFLIGHGAIQTLMIQFLGSNTGPVARSLAENIFQAALKADNDDIIEFLLDNTKLVDANDTVCHHYGQRYTPIEIAAMMLSSRVLKVLMDRKVDVNKSFSQGHRINALSLLIDNGARQSILHSRFLGLVDALMEAGATVSVDLVQKVLEEFVDPRLATSLIRNSTSQSLRKFLSARSFLAYLLRYLKKAEALSMMKFILERCGGLGVNAWLNSPEFKSAPLEVVEVRYKALAESVIRDTSTDEISRMTGNQATINLLNALNSRDQDRLLILEEGGIIKHLKHDELGQALTTALNSGNLQFATKILDFDPDCCFADYPNNYVPRYDHHTVSAFAAALAHNFDDIAWRLLAVATTKLHARNNGQLLAHAIRAKKPNFVRAMLEFYRDRCNQKGLSATPYATEGSSDAIEQAVIKWGDLSIMIDICRTRISNHEPHIKRFLKFAVERGQVDLFFRILEAIPPKMGSELSIAAEVAIECNNLTLLDELIVRGVGADNDHLLDHAMIHCPSLVRPLLERYRKAYPKGSYFPYGREIIAQAIRRYPQSSELLNIFFEFQLINGMTLGENEGHSNLLAIAIGDDKPIHRAKHPREPIHRAKHPREHIIKRLLDAGGDANCWFHMDFGSTEKTTPFLQAIKTENTEIVQLLIKDGRADVNMPTGLGIMLTPLQTAAELNNLEIVSLLLENGADVNAPPERFSGATALQFAAIHGNCDMALMLIERGAQLDIAPPLGFHGRWPLEGAAENGLLDMIQLLWDANNGPFDDKLCRSAMRLAERQGHLGCRDLILELMAKPSIEYQV
ncbi:hypothetical protein F4803DRAFT_529368 [Xylaria telfairii]|nr:hypothetical protein F4803DRAFT_529368 [Xylaria telfairii]